MRYQSEYYGIATLGDSLYHHGIKGQKWGVRRYQNPDGTLTAEGKARYKRQQTRQNAILRDLSNTLNNFEYGTIINGKRYGDPIYQRKSNVNSAVTTDFSTAKQNVISNASNAPSSFHKQPIDISTVKQRGSLSTTEAKQCAALATTLYEKASKIEPKLTADVIHSVSSSGGKMYGLDYRLKQPTSIAAKIGSDAKEDGISFTSAAKNLKDIVRYTSVTSERNFVDSYNKTKTSLEEKGYRETRCKNYFDMYKQGKVMHKSIQSVFEDSKGNKFELQFQTPSSQAAKELKVPIYEERRKAGISANRAAELEGQMKDLAEMVKTPKRVSTIKSH